MKTILNILILLLIPIFSYSQEVGYIADEEVIKSDVKPWIGLTSTEYQGVYSLGFSEGSYDMALFFANGQYHGQISFQEWGDNGFPIFKYQNLENVKVKGNKFLSNKYNGKFIIYQGKKGIKINGGIGDYEIGVFHESLVDYFPGKYPHASLTLLSKYTLKDMTYFELKIMRNEIFARYGYIFKLNGKMDKYFKKQGWYRPQHKDVSAFLTTIEKKNIKLIKSFESRKP
ncbi:YARHG domain-containing protein [Candidatus Venteria ishoeyi]|uniref:YARHG domain-containing protein n=1 Tax=Candidatus Venteria ishoeyi TaxID=1899563 RepID=UPI0025A5D84C|nr:YARHG domain-containing protein [Candidatus Venteria ishoeyi]MDM8545116.1 YARHG domain-containing protein [Candidatus Venteria ishoeyi]